MTELDVRMIRRMLNKQNELISDTMRKFDLKSISEEQISLALLCEVGEFISETKQEWCWWMENPPAVDESKKLGEFIDIWSLVLTRAIIGGHVYGLGCLSWINKFIEEEKQIYREFGLTKVLLDLVSYKSWSIEMIIVLSEELGYTLDQIYEEFMKKNEINHERLESGY